MLMMVGLLACACEQPVHHIKIPRAPDMPVDGGVAPFADPLGTRVTNVACCDHQGLDFALAKTIDIRPPLGAIGDGLYQEGATFRGLSPRVAGGTEALPAARFVDLGAVSNLSSISAASDSGFVDSVQVEAKHGYVVETRQRAADFSVVLHYARMYVASLLTDAHGKVIGSRIHWNYQDDGNTRFDGETAILRVAYERIAAGPTEAGTLVDAGAADAGTSDCDLAPSLPIITASMPGISCPDDCAQGFPPGAIALTAHDATCPPGRCCFRFAGWKNDACAGAGLCKLVKDLPTVATALIAR
jgi:hypothetical protein